MNEFPCDIFVSVGEENKITQGGNIDTFLSNIIHTTLEQIKQAVDYLRQKQTPLTITNFETRLRIIQEAATSN